MNEKRGRKEGGEKGREEGRGAEQQTGLLSPRMPAVLEGGPWARDNGGYLFVVTAIYC